MLSSYIPRTLCFPNVLTLVPYVFVYILVMCSDQTPTCCFCLIFLPISEHTGPSFKLSVWWVVQNLERGRKVLKQDSSPVADKDLPLENYDLDDSEPTQTSSDVVAQVNNIRSMHIICAVMTA